MHVGFEAKRFFNNFTGLGNYARFIVGALSASYPENLYTLFSPRIGSNPEYNSILQAPNVKAIAPGGLYRFLPGLWRSYGVSREASMNGIDIFHGLSQEIPAGLPSGIVKVVTVHDLIFLRYPQYYNPIDVAIYKAKVVSACNRADKIIAISKQTAGDVVSFLNIDPAKVAVVYQGCHPSFRVTASDHQRKSVRSKYGLPEKYLLNVGTIEERKNLGLLIEALPLIKEHDHIKLVVVGKPTKYKDKVLAQAKKLKVDSRILFLHAVSFTDLPAIYQMSEVFIYPSQFEGFGIPLVEAIESGTPVISSAGSCFSEAAGPHSLYAHPTDSAQLAGHISSVLGDPNLREQMIKGSADFIRKFEPKIIAQDLMREYSVLLK